ncbi:MAG TPA: carbonic anhydrase [Geminicoccaceae bacterium]|nr:carbonic anhydrase [Geminicoccaceae bacterium]
MEKLIAGYQRFRASAWPQQKARFLQLASGQTPKTMVIGCSDSRVDPQQIFAAGPGELFVVRNVANLVPPYAPDSDYHGTSAALEFAVRALEVEDLVVLGHGACGGVGVLLNGPPAPLGDFLAPWMEIAAAARERALRAAGGAGGEALQRRCEHEVVKVSLANLLSFPWLAERVAAGTLALHGCWFEVGAGTLMRLGAGGEFEAVPTAP